MHSDFNNKGISFDPRPSQSGQILTGRRFFRLKVLSIYGRDRHRQVHWLCRCDCGSFCLPTSASLLGGYTLSCGCWGREASTIAATTHGAKSGGKITTEYGSYSNAKHRCTYPSMWNYCNYGGRGIEFRFTSFEEFLEHLGRKPSPQHSLDRIDVNGHYEKGNVRWATRSEQARNRRDTPYITIDGVRKSTLEWSEIYNIRLETIRRRIRRYGWDEVRAVTTPSRQSKNPTQAVKVRKDK